MRHLILLLIVVLAIPVLPGSAAPKAGLARAVLDNGLTILVYENHAAEIVTLEAWAKVGSRDETDELNGAAHFIEHMLPCRYSSGISALTSAVRRANKGRIRLSNRSSNP